MSSELRFDGRIVDLRADPTVCAELARLYDTHKRGQDYPLFCIQPHRGRMYLWRSNRDGQLWASHYPRQSDGCSVRIPGPEGIAHHRVKDYIGGAAQRAGYTVTPEYTTSNHTRLDLLIDAPFRFGVEAQISPITERAVKTRTTRSTNAGIPPIWVATETRPFPYAPNIGFNRELDWTAGMPPKGSVTALHMKHITAEHCTPYSRFDHCPDGRNSCGGWHPYYDALPGWTLDDAIAGIGDHQLEILQTATKAVYLVTLTGLELYRELTGHDGMFTPGAPGRRAAPPPQELIGVECAADRPIPETAPTAELLLTVPEIEDVPFRLPPIEWSICQKCGRDICHPDSIADGLCRGCSLKLDAVLRRRGIA